MIPILNQFSFVLFMALFALLLVVVLFWEERSRRKQVVTMVLFVIVVGAYFWLRPGASNVTASEIDVITAAVAGEGTTLVQPVFIDAYSNY
jgi:drug/metabolite transporter (DMT)-like permease